MDGQAFAQGPEPLYAPPMCESVYKAVKKSCLQSLDRAFDLVACPVQGPGKKEYSDIDIFVTGPENVDSNKEEILSCIETLLGAKRTLGDLEKGANIAIQWPMESPGPEHTSATNLLAVPRYVQVNVRLFDTKEKFMWMVVEHAHGDFWNILSATIDPYGLTFEEHALWVRIPEIEHKNKERAKVFLSGIPKDILDFLDMKPWSFLDPYWSLGDMFEDLANCRMFCPTSSEWARYRPGYQSTDLAAKASYHKRLTRPVFKTWVVEFLPDCAENLRYYNRRTTREAVLEEVFARFDVRERYEERRRGFLIEEQRHSVQRIIKSQLPQVSPSQNAKKAFDGASLRETFRRIIIDGDESFPVLPEDNLRLSNGFFNVPKIQSFIETYKNNKALALAASERQRQEMESALSPSAPSPMSG